MTTPSSHGLLGAGHDGPGTDAEDVFGHATFERALHQASALSAHDDQRGTGSLGFAGHLTGDASEARGDLDLQARAALACAHRRERISRRLGNGRMRLGPHAIDDVDAGPDVQEA